MSDQERWLSAALRAVEALVPVFGKVGGVLSCEAGDVFEVEVYWCRDEAGRDTNGNYLTLVDAGGPGDPVKYAAALREALRSRGLVLPEPEATG